MKDEHKCPAPEDLGELLCAMLDAVPAPDLTGRVMAGIAEAGSSAAGRVDAGLVNIFSYLVTAGVGLALVLAYSFLPGLINFELRPVAVVQLLTAMDRLAGFIGETLGSIAAGIIPGAPLLPPLIIVLAVLLVNLIGKRRISDV